MIIISANLLPNSFLHLCFSSLKTKSKNQFFIKLVTWSFLYSKPRSLLNSKDFCKGIFLHVVLTYCMGQSELHQGIKKKALDKSEYRRKINFWDIEKLPEKISGIAIGTKFLSPYICIYAVETGFLETQNLHP